jgi:hypothetical protein
MPAARRGSRDAADARTANDERPYVRRTLAPRRRRPRIALEGPPQRGTTRADRLSLHDEALHAERGTPRRPSESAPPDRTQGRSALKLLSDALGRGNGSSKRERPGDTPGPLCAPNEPRIPYASRTEALSQVGQPISDEPVGLHQDGENLPGGSGLHRQADLLLNDRRRRRPRERPEAERAAFTEAKEWASMGTSAQTEGPSLEVVPEASAAEAA